MKLSQGNVEKNANKALINYQADKHDEILKLQKENNELLKKMRPKKRESTPAKRQSKNNSNKPHN